MEKFYVCFDGTSHIVCYEDEMKFAFNGKFIKEFTDEDAAFDYAEEQNEEAYELF